VYGDCPELCQRREVIGCSFGINVVTKRMSITAVQEQISCVR
jgi:hypothetical protein